MCMSPSFIIRGHAAMHSLPYCSFILRWFWCLRTEQDADKHNRTECCASLPTFSPSSAGRLSSKTWTSLDQPVWVAGRPQFAQAEEAWGDRHKAKSAAKLGCFSKGEIITLFFPFQDTCQGSISGKWKDRAVFLGLWSGMITDRKDKCTFSGARATVKVTEKVEAFSH